MRARDIMTSPAITVTPEVPVRGAAALLVSHGFTALPVVDDDKNLIGIVTEADLLRNGYVDETRGTTVGDMMTTPAFAMDGDAKAEVLARVMIDDPVVVKDGEATIGLDNPDDETERVLTAPAGSVHGVLRVHVPTGEEK